MRLVSLHKVENIEAVAEKMNTFIDFQANGAEHKSSVECMDRWLLLRNNTEDGTVK